MKVVAITGYKGSGKDTIGNAIRSKLEEMGYNVGIYKLAEPLHEALQKVSGKDSEEAKDLPVWMGYSGRAFMRMLGAGAVRIDPYVFIRRVLRRIDEECPDVAIVTDLRLIREATAFKEFFGDDLIILRINAGVLDAFDDMEVEIDSIKPHFVVHNEHGYTKPERIAEWFVKKLLNT